MQSDPETMNEQFRTDWSRFHHNLEPTGWLLRAGSIPWVRFHALPDSKRYAEDATERATILTRAYALAADVLGQGAPCWKIVSETGEKEVESVPALEWTYDDDGDPSIWYSYVSLIEWRSGEHDQVLTDIAEWKTANEVWMARATGEIFAPYDGGFDIFPSDWTRVAFLKQKWGEWLSSHPGGL